jgi:hypothetical protein
LRSAAQRVAGALSVAGRRCVAGAVGRTQLRAAARRVPQRDSTTDSQPPESFGGRVSAAQPAEYVPNGLAAQQLLLAGVGRRSPPNGLG